MRSPSLCHPHLPIHARGVCQQCYHKIRQSEDKTYLTRLRSYKTKKERERIKTSKGGCLRQIKGTPMKEVKTFYEEKLISQECHCAICGGTESKDRLCLDHCHTTNKMRGLLCKHCNFILGLAKDNPDILQRAAEYLITSAT